MSEFKLKFDGEINQIDADVLVNSLIHTTNVIQEINRLIDSGKRIEIKVKAPEKGSFLIQINLIESVIESLKGLFTTENITVTASIVTILLGAIKIKKFLKGGKPKEIKENDGITVVINQEMNEFRIESNIYNIYDKSQVIKDSLAQNFESIQNDPSITAYEITDINEKPLVRIERGEFDTMAIKSEELSEGERIITEAATLNIVRLSFEGALKWDFYFRGNKISAKIKDNNFYKLIDKGESFAKGDVLEVELQIIQKWDESVNTFVNKTYQVMRILRHLPRNEQQKFKFEK